MAISGIGMGLSRKSVASAAGISMTSLSHWVAVASRPKAKELKLVIPEAVAMREASPVRDLISIRLASGVEIDFPRSELSLEFLETLSRIGGR